MRIRLLLTGLFTLILLPSAVVRGSNDHAGAQEAQPPEKKTSRFKPDPIRPAAGAERWRIDGDFTPAEREKRDGLAAVLPADLTPVFTDLEELGTLSGTPEERRKMEAWVSWKLWERFHDRKETAAAFSKLLFDAAQRASGGTRDFGDAHAYFAGKYDYDTLAPSARLMAIAILSDIPVTSWQESAFYDLAKKLGDPPGGVPWAPSALTV